jgi:hypothetical protein
MDDRQRNIERARSNAARRAKRTQLLGVENPSCAICGYNQNPASLEAHHIAGEANQELSVLLCRTCHDDLSDTAIVKLPGFRGHFPLCGEGSTNGQETSSCLPLGVPG